MKRFFFSKDQNLYNNDIVRYTIFKRFYYTKTKFIDYKILFSLFVFLFIFNTIINARKIHQMKIVAINTIHYQHFRFVF